MAYNMALQYDGKLYSIVIPPEEYHKIEKDPSLVAKYWELLNVHQTEGKTLPKRTPEDGAQAMFKNEIDNKGHKWTYFTLQRLIHYRKKYRMVHFCRGENELNLWETIAEKVNKRDYSFSPEECKSKWLKVVETYEQMKYKTPRGQFTLREWKIFSLIENALKKEKLKKSASKETVFCDKSPHVSNSSGNTNCDFGHGTSNTNLGVLKESFGNQDGDSSPTSELNSLSNRVSLSGDSQCSIENNPKTLSFPSRLCNDFMSSPPQWFSDFEQCFENKFENFESFLYKEIFEIKEVTSGLKDLFGKRKLQ